MGMIGLVGGIVFAVVGWELSWRFREQRSKVIF
jgi:hypothetical protein